MLGIWALARGVRSDARAFAPAHSPHARRSWLAGLLLWSLLLQTTVAAPTPAAVPPLQFPSLDAIELPRVAIELPRVVLPDPGWHLTGTRAIPIAPALWLSSVVTRLRSSAHPVVERSGGPGAPAPAPRDPDLPVDGHLAGRIAAAALGAAATAALTATPAAGATSGTATLYFHRAASDANSTYNALTLTPPTPTTATNTALQATLTTHSSNAPCEDDVVTTTITGLLIDTDSLTAYGTNLCVGTFYSPPFGQSVTMETTDTNALAWSVYASTTAATWGTGTRPNIRLEVFKCSTCDNTAANYTLVGTLNTGAFADATYSNQLFTATGAPSANVTFAAGDRLVARMTWIQPDTEDSGGGDTATISWGTPTVPTRLTISYTYVTPNKPSLTNTYSEDFTAGTGATNCTSAGATFDTDWVCKTPNGNTGTYDNSLSSEWIVLKNVSQTTPSNFGATPTNTFLYRNTVFAGSGTFQTVVNAAQDNSGSSAGLLIWSGNTADPYLILESYYDGTNRKVRVNNAGTLGTASANIGTWSRVWLRWTKTGISYQGAYSTDGSTWTNIGTSGDGGGAVTYGYAPDVGLNVYSATNGTDYSAAFEYLQTSLYGLMWGNTIFATGAVAGGYRCYALTLTNTGTDNDSFTVSTSDSRSGDGYTSAIYSDSGCTSAQTTFGPLASGANTNVYVRVNVPGGRSLGEQNVTTVTGTSVGNGGVSASELITTTVSEPATITATTGKGAALPGGSVCYTRTLVNNQVSSDTIGVAVSGDSAGFTTTLWSSADCSTTPAPGGGWSISAGGTQTFYARVAIGSAVAAQTMNTTTLTARYANNTTNGGAATLTTYASSGAGGTTRLYFDRWQAASAANSNYAALTFGPPTPNTATAGTASTAPTAVNAPCKDPNTTALVNAAVVNVDATSATGEYCLMTFYSPPAGRATTISTTDTGALGGQVYLTTTATTSYAATVQVRLFRCSPCDGSGANTFTAITGGTNTTDLRTAAITTSAVTDSVSAFSAAGTTPAQTVSLTPDDRIVAVLYLHVTVLDSSTGTDTTTVTFGRSTLPAYVSLGYTLGTPERPPLDNTIDDDFTTTAATTSCTTAGSAAYSVWTSCKTISGNAGNYNANSDASSWLWLQNKAQTTPVHFGTGTATDTYLYQSVPSGDVSYTTVVNAPQDQSGSAAGIVLYTNATTHMTAETLWDGANRVVRVWKDGAELGGSKTTLASSWGRVWLRITKTSTSYQAAYSTDGVTFTNFGSAQTYGSAFTQVGLFAYSASSTHDYSAAFEYFRVAGATNYAALTQVTADQTVSPGGSACYQMRLTNNGNQTQTLAVDLVQDSEALGWTTSLWSTSDCSTTFLPPASASWSLGAGASQTFYLKVLAWQPTPGRADITRLVTVRGATGAFSTSGQSQLGTAVDYNPGSLAHGPYLYLIGGANGGSLTTVQRAAVGTASDVGAWSTTNQGQLPAGRDSLAVTKHTIGTTTYFYAIGGSNAGCQTTVYKATLSSAGNVGTWSTTSQGQLPAGRCGAAATVATVAGTTYIYVAGGESGDGVGTTTVYKATINSSGDIGTWSATGQSALPANRKAHDMAVVTAADGATSYLVVVGGDTSGSVQTTVWRGALQTNGDVTGWTTDGQGQLPVARNDFGFAQITLGGVTHLYVVGGNGSSNVLHTTVDPLGNVGLWANEANGGFAAFRTAAFAYAHAGRAYLVQAAGNSGGALTTVSRSLIATGVAGVTTTTSTYGARLGATGTVSTSSSTVCMVTPGGGVRCWGANGSGQLGLGHTNDIGDNELALTDVNLNGATAVQVSASPTHTCALLSTGSVRCWGSNTYGQLGLGTTVTIGDDESPTTDVNLGNGVYVNQVAAGTDFTCALLATGNVRCWGWNAEGELGLGNTTQIGDDESPTTDVNLGGATVTQISAGYAHTCALLSTGNVRCWGYNTSGQLGLGHTNLIGDNESPTTDVNLGGTTVTQVAAGVSHTCALLSTGNVRCWGANGSGQLGLGNTTQIGDNESPTTDVNLGGATAIQIAVGTLDDNSCALLSTGNVRCWGANGSGQLGLGNTTQIGDNESPTTDAILGGATVVEVTAGRHACALLSTGNVRCWGDNLNGQLGLGHVNHIGDNETPSIDTPLVPTTVHLASGNDHTCAVLGSGAVRCWGWNVTGQLGLAHTSHIGDDERVTANVNLSGAAATQVVTGRDHTCALLSTGNVRCWGYNTNGELGLGNTTQIGDDELPTTDVNLGGATVRQIAAGGRHTCALLTTGNVRCWGYNTSGQLGLGHTNNIGDNESPTTDVNLGGATVTQIVAGGEHTCALLSTGNVRCWGSNNDGDLGLGHVSNIGDNESPTTDVNLGGAAVVRLAAGGRLFTADTGHTCALLATGSVRCWGANSYGQLGIGSTNEIGDDESPTTNVDLGGATVVDIAAGQAHSCAVTSAATVRCWGRGTDGRLGYGNTNTLGEEAGDLPLSSNVDLAGTGAFQVAAGTAHTCALLGSRSVRCWGDGTYGQPGLASMSDIGDLSSPTADAFWAGGRDHTSFGLRRISMVTTACHRVLLANVGPATDTVGIALSGNAWTTTLHSASCSGSAWSSASLATGAVAVVYAKVTPGAGASDTARLTPRVNANSTDSWMVRRVTAVLGSVSVTVTSNTTGRMVPGGVACYAFSVNNLAGTYDTFTVTTADSRSADGYTSAVYSDATCTTAQASYALNVGASASVYVKVNVPAARPLQETNVTTVTATSTTNGAVSGSATATTTVVQRTRLYVHTTPNGANGAYGSLALAPNYLNAAVSTATNGGALGIPCGSAVAGNTTIRADIGFGTGNKCLATFFSPPVGQTINISTADTSSVRFRLTTYRSGTASATLHADLFKYDGSTYTSFAAGSLENDFTTGTVRSFDVTPSTNVTINPTDRIVMRVYLNNAFTFSSTYAGISVGTASTTNYVEIDYTFSTPNRPDLAGANDDDLSSVATATCSAGGVTYNTSWTCRTPSGTAGAFDASQTTTQWLLLTGRAAATPSHFGTTPTNTYIHRSVPAGDWVASTAVNTSLLRSGAAAGVVLWTSDTDFITVESAHDGTNRGVRVNNSGTPGSLTTVSSERVWLRIAKSRTSYQPSYSTDGSTWTNLGTAITHATAFTRVGPTVFSNHATDDQTAAFEFFDLAGGALISGPGALATGGAHTCALLATGNVRCWGQNVYGQLGLGNTTPIGDNESPTTDVNLGGTTVAAVTGGNDHTCALLATGNVRCWGNNSTGQLGLGNTTTIGDDESPTTDVNLGGATVDQIASGVGYVCALLATGDVRCWGTNDSGQLGLASTTTIGDDESPTTNVNLDGATAVQIAVGTDHTCALLSTGSVRCWGRNNVGQLGLGNTTWIGDDEDPTVDVDLGGTTVVQIGAGQEYTCALLSTGNVRCWGRNNVGQLGLGNTTTIGDDEDPTTDVALGGTTAVQIAVGKLHACALLSTGNVRCWGYNSTGQLGIASTADIGDNENPTTDVNLSGTTVVLIAAGGDHTCALLATGNVRCWGYGFNGQLGTASAATIGDNESPTTDVNLGGTLVAAVDKRWGAATEVVCRPIVVSNTGAAGDTIGIALSGNSWTTTLHAATSASCGGAAWSSATLASGAVALVFVKVAISSGAAANTTDTVTLTARVSGNTINSGAAARTTVSTGGAVLSGPGAIDSGDYQTCVVLATQNVRCWGYNTNGQLGLGNTATIGDNEIPVTDVNLGGAQVTAVAMGGSHSCALLATGNVRCWGLNNYGQLGLGNTTQIGDTEDPTTDVDLGGTKVIAVTAGQYHTCALLATRNVRCWGLNDNGQLGLGNTTEIGDNELPTTDVDLGGTAVTAVTAGGYHTCALLATGNVRCWGYNQFGRLGLGHTSDIGDDELPTTDVNLGGTAVVAVETGSTYGYHTCAILSTGNVRCWGINTTGALGLGHTNHIGDDESPTTDVNLGGATVVAVAPGGSHTCALLGTGNVRCWGSNGSGQLGLGNTTQIGDNESPTTDVDLGGATAVAVAVGGQAFSCALLASGNVRCWGYNLFGQLGRGDTTTIGDTESPNTTAYDVGLGTMVVARGKIWGAGGSNACYPVHLANIRAVSDTIGITDSGNSWTTSVRVGTDATCGGAAWSNATLAAGAVTRVFVRVTIDGSAAQDTSDTVTLTARAYGETRDSGTATRTTVSTGPACSTCAATITATTANRSGDPGTAVQYELTLQNTGPATDTIGVTLADSATGFTSALFTGGNYDETVLTDSPALYWRLGEAAGTTVNDASVNSRPGTYNGSPSLGVTGAVVENNTAVRFSTSSQHVTSDAALNMTGTALSMEAWLKADAFAAPGPGIMNVMGAEFDNGTFLLRFGDDGIDNDQAQFVLECGGSTYKLASATHFSVGTWYHVAVTYDGTDMKIYVNGALDSSVGRTGSCGANGTFRLSLTEASRTFRGTLDEVAVYTSTALTLARVQAHYNAGIGTAATTFTLNASETQTIYVRVTIPTIASGNAAAGTTDTLTVTPKVGNNLVSYPAGQTTRVTTVNQVYRGHITAGADQTAAPGGSACYTVTVYNDGNGSDAIQTGLADVISPSTAGFTSAMYANPGCSGAVSWGSIAAGGNATYYLKVSVPALSSSLPALGTTDTTTLTAKVNGGALDYPGVNGASRDVTVTTVTQAYAATIAVTEAGQSADPGSSACYTLTLTNTGNGSDTIGIVMSGNSWTTTLHSASCAGAAWTPGSLNAAATATVYAKVVVPSGSAAGATDSVTWTSRVTDQAADSGTAARTTTANQVYSAVLSGPGALAAGEDFTCALMSTGAVRCWGLNTYGQLGLGHTSTIGDAGGEIPLTTNVDLNGTAAVQVTAGLGHVCALLATGDVRCWGRNDYGQLGLGHTNPIGDAGGDLPITTNVDLGGAKVIQVAAGGLFTCALLANGRVRCWGANVAGALGLGHMNAIGDAGGELPITANVDLGGATAVQIGAGDEHACALLDTGNVRCWGQNNAGQLGLGHTNDIGDDSGDLPIATDVNLGGTAVAQLAVAEYGVCSVLATGNVRCWGYNGSGALGLGHLSNIGDNESPTTDVNLGGAVVVQVATHGGGAVDPFVCALLSTGAVRCWGYNGYGQLGLGHTNNIGDDGGELPISGNVGLGTARAMAVTTGMAHACALVTSGDLRCWGAGANGQLGLGSATHIGDDESPTTNASLGGTAVVAAGKRWVTAGQSACHPVFLANTGNGTDTVGIALSGNSWTTTLHAGTSAACSGSAWSDASIVSGGVTRVFVKVAVPGAAVVDVSDTVTLTSRVNGGTVNSGTAARVTVSRGTVSLAFSPNRAGAATSPGSKCYSHTLTNTGNSTDTFTIARSDSLSANGWTSAVYADGGCSTTPQTSFNLAASAATTVYVLVTAPASRPLEEVNTTTVTATSANDAGVNASVTETTTVGAGMSGMSTLYLHRTASDANATYNSMLLARPSATSTTATAAQTSAVAVVPPCEQPGVTASVTKIVLDASASGPGAGQHCLATFFSPPIGRTTVIKTTDTASLTANLVTTRPSSGDTSPMQVRLYKYDGSTYTLFGTVSVPVGVINDGARTGSATPATEVTLAPGDRVVAVAVADLAATFPGSTRTLDLNRSFVQIRYAFSSPDRPSLVGAGDDDFSNWRGVISYEREGAYSPQAVASDATSVYVSGLGRPMSAGSLQWHHAKFNKTTGLPDLGFGTAGSVTHGVDPSSPDPVEGNVGAIAVDGSYLYVVGNEGATWRIEKRDKSTGALVGGFGTGGVITSAFGVARAVAVDANYLYVAGDENFSEMWRVEKRNITTGALCDGVGNCAAGQFGTGGVLSLDIGNNAIPDEIRSIHIDASHLYLVGPASGGPTTATWRIEKRDIATGALAGGFGTGGVVSITSSDSNANAMRIAGDATNVYVFGTWGATGSRLEKRAKADGTLVGGFGASGVVTPPNYTGKDIALDGGDLYTLNSGGIEKYGTADGSRTDAFGEAGRAGVYAQSAADLVMVVDGDGIFVAETPSDPDTTDLWWQVTKTDKTTGQAGELRQCASDAPWTTMLVGGKWRCYAPGAFSGDFEGHALASDWLVLRDTAGAATATFAGNVYLYQLLQAGDGVVRTVASSPLDVGTSAASAGAGGVALWTSNTDYLVVEAFYDGTTRGVRVNNSGTYANVTAVAAHSRIWLGITKIGTDYQPQYSTDGSTWNDLGSAVSHPTAFTRTGLTVASGTSGDDFAMAFEWFDTTLPTAYAKPGIGPVRFGDQNPGPAAVCYTHTLENNGSIADTITVSTAAPAGWTVTTYDTVGCVNATTAWALGAGATATIYVNVVPAGLPDPAASTYPVTLTATSANDANAKTQVADQITIGQYVELTMDHDDGATPIDFGNVNPITATVRTNIATVKSNGAWVLKLFKVDPDGAGACTGDMTTGGAGCPTTLPSSRLEWKVGAGAYAQITGTTAGSAQTLQSSGSSTGGTNVAVDYRLTLTWTDAPGTYGTTHTYQLEVP